MLHSSPGWRTIMVLIVAVIEALPAKTFLAHRAIVGRPFDMLPNMLVIVTSLPHTLHELLAVCMSSNIIVKLTHLRDKLHVDVDVRTPVHCTD